MKIKLWSLLLLISLFFTFTGCNAFNIAKQSSSVADNGDNVTPPIDDDESRISPINVIMINDNHGILNEENGSIDKLQPALIIMNHLAM